MVLRSRSRRQHGARGSYCWGDETEGCCIDAGPAYPADKLYLYLEESPELDFSELGLLAELVYEIWPSRIIVVDQGFSWTDETPALPIRRQSLARPKNPVRFPDDLPHGLYLINVFADVAAGGSTSQGFRIYVGPETEDAMRTRMAGPAGTPWPAPAQP
jgi:hypothetical protein